MPLVSVIIPTYGEPDLLEKSISSVLAQTMGDLELIVVDDNNPDTEFRKKTAEIVNEFADADKRVIYLCHERNKNGAAARNTGIAVANGKYIAFLDSDDEFYPDRFEKCIKTLEKSTDEKCAGVYTGCEFFRGGKQYSVFDKAPSGNFLKETLACTFRFYTGSNIFMRAEAVRELGFDEKFLRHQDYEFLVRYFEKYNLTGLNEVLVKKNNENRNLPNPEKISSIKNQYLEKYKGIIGQLDADSGRFIFHSQYIAVAEAYAAAGNGKKATEYRKKAAQYGAVSFKSRLRIFLKTVRYKIFIRG